MVASNGDRAHALMFLGRAEEARALYLKFRGARAGDESWDAMILRHFARLRQSGLTKPLMDEIEKQLAGS
jgi:hypothetical protein